MEIMTGIGAVLAAVVAAYLTVRKTVGEMTTGLVQQYLKDHSLCRHSVAIVADVAHLGLAGELRTMLVRRSYRNVYVRDVEKFEKSGDQAVIVIQDGIDLPTFATNTGLAEGLIYTTGRANPPAGDWTFANSGISLYARLRELIEWIRAAEKA
jgi:hypothetical protein